MLIKDYLTKLLGIQGGIIRKGKQSVLDFFLFLGHHMTFWFNFALKSQKTLMNRKGS